MEEIKDEGQIIDLSKIPTSHNIADMYQEGNFLVIRSDLNQTFRQAIKPGLILNKNEKGEWILQKPELRH